MFWTLLALILWIILGGFIAYYGDLQGRRWGKKRVSWFGLRPKHTAILITSLTGGFIALLSIGTLLAISAPVRDVILNGEIAIVANKRLNTQLVLERRTSAQELHAAQQREREAVQQTDIARLDLQKASTDLVAASRAAGAKKAQLDKLVARVATLSARYAGTQERLTISRTALLRQKREVAALQSARRDLLAQNQNAAEINAAMGAQNMRLTREDASMERRGRELAQSNAKLTDARQQLTGQNEELAGAKRALLRANQNILDANDEQIRRANDLESRIRQLQARQTEIQDKYDRLNTEYASLSDARQSIAREYYLLRQSKFSMRSGAELARKTIDAHLRGASVRADLERLLDEANVVALRRGAVPGANRRAVQIVSKRITTLAGTQDTDEESSLQALTDRLTAGSQPVVVVVKTVTNTMEGEQAAVELMPFAVKHTFDKGQVVATGTINAEGGADQIVESLVRFLNTEAREAALAAGAIPQTDPETGQQRIGTVATGDLFALTDKIRRMGGMVKITAVAAAKTTSADPLLLNFKLGRAEPQ